MGTQRRSYEVSTLTPFEVLKFASVDFRTVEMIFVLCNQKKYAASLI